MAYRPALHALIACLFMHITTANDNLHQPTTNSQAIATRSALPQSPDTFELLPIAMGNRSPVSLIFSNPLPIYNMPADRKMRWRLDVDGSSHSIIQTSDIDALETDGETYRLSLNLQMRLHSRWLLHADIPFLSHSAGLFDAFIDRWHQISGLPDGERDQQPRDELFFGVRRGSTEVLLQQNQQRIGDISIGTSYHIDPQSTTPTSLQLMLKLPTGESSSFTGSGKLDAALGVNHQRATTFLGHSSVINLSAGVTYLGASEILGQQQRSLRSNLSMHLGWRWRPRITPEIQLRWQSALADDTVPHLSEASLTIDVGVQVDQQFGTWKLGLSEDIRVDSSPDVSLYCSYVWRR